MKGWAIVLAAMLAVAAAGRKKANKKLPGLDGTKYVIIEEGKKDGPVVQYGDRVIVEATIERAKDDSKIWSTRDGWPHVPFNFLAGKETGLPFTGKGSKWKGFKGFEQGVLGMKLGEKRNLTVQPIDGYGERGFGFGVWKIPENCVINVELETVEVKYQRLDAKVEL